MTVLIKRGMVFLVNFDPAIGSEAKKARPGLIVSNDINNAHSPMVSIAPITSKTKRIYSFEVEIPAGEGGLDLRSKAMINQTRAIDKQRLIRFLGEVSPDTMNAVNGALRLHFSLE